MPGAFRRKRAREQQRVRVDANGMMRHVIGDVGLGDEAVTALALRLDEIAVAIDRQRRAGAAGFAALPYAKTEVRRTARLAEQVRGAFDDLVVLGGGTLALGARALVSAVAPAGSTDGTATPGALRVHFADRLDPESLAALLARLDLRRTLFNVVSGSGDAIETISQFLIVRDRLLKDLGAVAYKQHVVITTRTGEGPLRQIVNDEGFRDLPFPSDIDDAFALLTPAALFPVSCSGADVSELLAGAADMDERCRNAETEANPARVLATALLLGREHRRPQLVVRASAVSLQALAGWIERLGSDNHGDACGRANAPETGMEAGGAVDDPAVASMTTPERIGRVVLFLHLERRAHEIEVPKAYQDLEGVGYLGGLGLGVLADLQQQAAELALWSAGCPTTTIRCPQASAYVVGQVVFLVEMATALARGVGGNVPGAVPGAVEASVRFAYGLAGRPGYEAERAEAQRWLARKETRYVV